MVIPMKKKARVPSLRWAWMVSSTICLAYFGSGAIIRLIEWIIHNIL